jgi:hypothetical protein
MASNPAPQGKIVKGTGQPRTPTPGKPYLGGNASSQATYLGRVIIEVWDNPNYPDPSWGFSYTYDLGTLTTVTGKQLLQRVADKFPQRFGKDRDSMQEA